MSEANGKRKGHSRKHPASTPAAIDTKERQAQALTLRKSGADYEAIAGQLGYAGPSGAYRAVMAALREIPTQDAADLRAEVNARLDRLIMGHWTKAIGGDSRSAMVIIRAEERRAKMTGIDLEQGAPPYLPLLVIAVPGRPPRILRSASDLENLTSEERASLTSLPQVIREDAAYAGADWDSVLAFDGQSYEVPSGGALVDAYTFATHPDYCALDLTDKPMQVRILNEYMRAGAGYTELVCICGMRSGKGTVGSVIAWYEIYQLMEKQNPQRYYGLAPGQTIGTLNIGTSEAQAKKNVFKHIRDRIHHGGRWFAELKLFLDRKRGEWETDLEIKLPKDLVMRSGNSRSAANVGGTQILVLFDEICKYKSEGGADNARDVYSNVKATTATFGEDARIVSISSPEWERDYGMQLLQMALEHDDSPLAERCEACGERAQSPGYQASESKSHPRMYGIHMATWEANTRLTREQLYELENGAGNPREFARNFGARPVGSSETYYPDPERWDRQHTAALVAAGLLDADPLRYPYDDKGALAEWWGPCCPATRYVHIDLALTRDACGMAMAHQSIPGCRWFTMVEGEPNPLARKVVVDVSVQVKPPRARPGEARGEISFERIRQRVRDWKARGFNIAKVTLDGWQCTSEDTRIWSSRGMLMAREIERGDIVQSRSGPRAVTNKWTFQGVPALRIVTTDGHEITVTEGHKLEVGDGWTHLPNSAPSPRRLPVWRWRRADDLRVGDYVHIWKGVAEVDVAASVKLCQSVKPGRVPVRMPTEMNVAFAELLGLVWGDGYMHPDLFRLTTALDDTDDAANLIEAVLGVKPKRQGKSNGCQAVELTINSRPLMDMLRINGLWKSDQIPPAVARSPRAVQAAFIRGLFSADGMVKKRDGQPSWQTNHVELARYVQDFLRMAFGIETCLTRYKRKGNHYPTKHMEVYIVSVRGSRRKFQEAVGFCYKSKADELARHADVRGRNFWTAIKSIERVEAVNVVDFAVEGDPSYLANGFVSHNSVDTIQQFRREGFRADTLSVDRDLKAHDALQELINTDELAFGYHPVLILEGKSLLLKAGRKVDHPDNGSKDVVDAVAGAASQASRKGGQKKFIGGARKADEVL